MTTIEDSTTPPDLRAVAEIAERELELAPAAVENLLDCHLGLCRWIAEQQRARGATLVLGVNGAQGSGKTTFCHFAELILERVFGLRTRGFSIDDLYLPKAERERLAREIHPLLRTRGVPGTHDVPLGLELLDRLSEDNAGRPIPLPSFDKSIDDRRPEADWQAVEGPVDVVVFEGWCVGIGPEPEDALDAPINRLEAEEDPHGTWRRWVNQRLATDYTELYARLHHLVFLQVPGFEQVREWRRLQEAKLARRHPGAPGLMDDDALDRFLQHYERLTRHALRTLPTTADAVCALDEDHRLHGPTWRGDRDLP